MFIGNCFNIKFSDLSVQNVRTGYQCRPVSFGLNKLERSPLNGDLITFTGENKSEKPKIIYDKNHYLKRIIFPEPTSLKDVTDLLLEPDIEEDLVCFSPNEIKGIGTSNLADVKIKELLGHGSTACAFLMEDGNVLKISCGDHFGRKRENFDIPVYKQGKLFKTDLYPGYIYYYIEQYANPDDVSHKETAQLVKQIKAKGYKTEDIAYDWNMKRFRTEQFGKTADGKVYLLDPQCAFKD